VRWGSLKVSGSLIYTSQYDFLAKFLRLNNLKDVSETPFPEFPIPQDTDYDFPEITMNFNENLEKEFFREDPFKSESQVIQELSEIVEKADFPNFSKKEELTISFLTEKSKKNPY